MSLDIYIVPLDVEAPCQPLACSFDEEVHAQVFRGSAIDLSRYPQLRKMANYSEDAQYVGGDLPALISELTEAIPKFDPAIARVLTEFRGACEKAKAEGQAVYCLCD
jgi:hypothetical protein